MQMNFGKHKGRPVSEVPTDYLIWALNKCECLQWDYYATMRRAIRDELEDRGFSTASDQDEAAPTNDLQKALKTWFAEMSRRWHPDRGGSDQAMAAVNDGYERLRKLFQ
jgi:hypothetical protein